MVKIICQHINVAAQKLVDAWYGKGPPTLRLSKTPPPSISRDTAENILAHLIIRNYLREDFHFTPYSTISYIRRGKFCFDLFIYIISLGSRLFKETAYV